jgi:hypothetical protein
MGNYNQMPEVTTPPGIDPKTVIERIYWDRVRTIPPEVKLRNCFISSQFCRDDLSRRIRDRSPNLSDRELRFAAAKWMYGGDPQTLKLLQMAAEHDKQAISG